MFYEACAYCESATKWVDLETYHFFCNSVCRSSFTLSSSLHETIATAAATCSESEAVIKTTRDIRKSQRSMVCSITGDQKCHILGLNAVKIIFNHYGFHCKRIDKKTLKALVIAINAKDNLYCCSQEQNVKDKYTEEQFLDCFLYKKIPYTQLDPEAVTMYTTMQRILRKVLKKDKSPVIEEILKDFDLIATSNK